MSTRRWFIDSFPQHAAAALGMPSLVTWIANSPEQFGYKMHTNIIHKPYTLEPDLKHSFLSEFEINAPANDFPFNSYREIFDADEIYNALINMVVPAPYTLAKPTPQQVQKFGTSNNKNNKNTKKYSLSPVTK